MSPTSHVGQGGTLTSTILIRSPSSLGNRALTSYPTCSSSCFGG